MRGPLFLTSMGWDLLDREEAIDKIRKCLALSDSPNENEARTALLMARKLMASYKIEENELNVVRNDEPEVRLSSVTYTTIRDNWMPNLMRMFSKRFCCECFSNREYGQKTRTASFVGLPSDVDVCVRAFEYTVAVIRSNCGGVRAKNDYRDSYARGFIRGLENAYKAQDAELEAMLCNERSLTTVMSIPESVKKYSQEHFVTKPWKKRSYDTNIHAYTSGYYDGKNHLNKKLEEDPEGITSKRARLPPKE